MGTPVFNELPAIFLGLPHEALQIFDRPPLELGHHLFITNPLTGNGTLARFDFTSSQHSAKAFVDASKIGDIPAPSDPTNNIDWLELTNVLGSLAKTVFRVQTYRGQPPASVSLHSILIIL